MQNFFNTLFKKRESNKQQILIFCGAGISAESGLATFRDTDGLWHNYNVDEVCNLKTFNKNKKLVFEFYNDRKNDILKSEPNIAHETIANIQHEYGIDNVKIFTSNIDNLLERAGCINVCHIHGDCKEMQCLDCDKVWNIGKNQYDINAQCPSCFSNNIKPNIVFFNENAPKYNELRTYFHSSGEIINEQIVPNIKLFIGSSFKVIKPSMLLPIRGRSILVDLNPDKTIHNQFEVVLAKPSTVGIIEAEKIIKNWYQN